MSSSPSSRPRSGDEKPARSVTEQLSHRLRMLRERRGLSLRAVARAAQISPSLLSQIERGSASPSLVSLVAIADALAVRPGDLLDDDVGSRESLVVRREDRRVIDDPLCRREYLMHLDDPRIEIAELFLPPGGSSRPELASHSGRDYGIVLEGEAVAVFRTHREHLREGDHIAFDGSEPHRLINDSDEDARVMWIVVLDFESAPGARGGRT